MSTHIPDDEVLSALLDAEPVGADAAHVADCAECQERLGVLRGAALAASVRPERAPAHVREAAVAHALASSSDAHPAGRLAAITPLSRRRRPATTDRRRLAPLPAAAVLVALVVGAGLLLNLTAGDNRTAPTALRQDAPDALTPTPGSEEFAESPAAGDSAAGLGDAGGGPRRTQSASGSPAGPADGGELGALDDIDAITQRADSDLEKTATAPSGERPCRREAAAVGVVAWQAGVTYKGTPAVAYRLSGADGQRITQVWSAGSCSSLARQAS